MRDSMWEYIKNSDGYSLLVYCHGDWSFVIATSSLDYVEMRYGGEYGLLFEGCPIAFITSKGDAPQLEYYRDCSPDLLHKLLKAK